jgi:gliding motility-associated-like protein
MNYICQVYPSKRSIMKQFFIFVLALLANITLFAQVPANNECSTAIDLGDVPTLAFCNTVYTNVNATESTIASTQDANIPTCFQGAQNDVWFSFTVPATATVLDYEITLSGFGDAATTIINPQMAVYNGECILDGLNEVYCAQAALNTNTLTIEAVGLIPGLTYYIRVNDFSATATPEWGNFTLCVDEFDPIFIMGEDASSSLCEGVLYDSGGEAGQYGPNENSTFTICPASSFSCLEVTLTSFNTEACCDDLAFFQGLSSTGAQIAAFAGTGGPISIQYDGCITVAFNSDNSVPADGFVINWTCLNTACTSPPITTCEDPSIIPSLPFNDNDVNTVTSGNAITDANSPCANDFFFSGNDMIYAYTSPGSECIEINVNGTTAGTGIGVFEGCPYDGGSCTYVTSNFAVTSPSIGSVSLENPGTYYIVVAAPNTATVFDIAIDTAQCLLQLPYAGSCDVALPINGCPQDQPQVLQVAPGTGDPDWNVNGVNDGCLLGPQENYTFLYFQAQTTGDLAFTLEAAVLPNEDSDIDFNIWGPLDSLSDLCEYAAVNQPVRSSYAAGADPTGLQAIHPVTGTVETDTWDCQGDNDDFVIPLPVVQGKWYLILIDDFGGAVEQGGISVDFTTTTDGVLGEVLAVTFSSDTAICLGQAVSLFGTGGTSYLWTPNTFISCTTCDTVVVSPEITTNYTVNMLTTCGQYQEDIKVEILSLDPQADQTICGGQVVELNAGPEYTSAEYIWTVSPASALNNLSCTDCPNPSFNSTVAEAGLVTFMVSLVGPSCSFMDTLTINVLPFTSPVPLALSDTTLCIGASAILGGPAVAGQTYIWASNPLGTISANSTLTVQPAFQTTFYVAITNSVCPLPLIDSSVVSIEALPIISLINGTTLCPNANLTLLNTQTAQSGVTYSWSPASYLSNANIAQPSITNFGGTTTYTLTADDNGCVNTDTVTISLVTGSVVILTGDSIEVCKNVSQTLIASAFPGNSQIAWTSQPLGFSSLGSTAQYNPTVTSNIFATITANGCNFRDTLHVHVDSLPVNNNIFPNDTTICSSDTVALTSPGFNAANFADMDVLWTVSAGGGLLTPVTEYQAIALPSATPGTYLYTRTLTNGVCSDVHNAEITVQSVANVSVVPNGDTVCIGQSVQLTATSAETNVFSWEAPAGVLSCLDCPNPTATVTQTSVISVTAVNQTAGCDGELTLVLFVPTAPTLTLAIDTDICPGESVVLNTAPGGAYTYAWTAAGGFSSANPNASVSPTETTTYNLVSTLNGCTFNDQVIVNVAIETVTALDDLIICAGTDATLTADGTGTGTYSWQPGGQTGSDITVSPVDNTTYTVTYAYGDGCTTTDAVTVTAADPFTVEIAANPDVTSVLQGTPIVLTANVVSGTPTDLSYVWYADTTVFGGNTQSVSVSPLTNPSFYEVEVTQAGGCETYATISFEVVVPDIKLPNVFTPNGDNLNETFGLILGNNVLFEIKSFKIYNRFGNVVFETSIGTQKWDGKLNGNEQPSDLYNYVLVIVQGDGTDKVISGEINLVR